ncbi:MAG: hypothetical protein QOE70_3655 [Chthoniobacter sp.]|jgi:sugar lactone lactonase YvrE|nr:hypothetical protein [Chthoniobacter sp.]
MKTIPSVTLAFLVVSLVPLVMAQPAKGEYWTWTNFAGSNGGPGHADGTGAAARFYNPCGLAVDANGNVYVADGGNSTIRKITAAGVVTTLAGTAGLEGSADGTGGAAQFKGPTGVAVDVNGNVYVADSGNGTIRKVTPAGVVTTLAGTAGIEGSADGTGGAAQFNGPTDVAVDADGNVYVSDLLNYTVRKVSAAGAVTTLAGRAGLEGSADGTGGEARFWRPAGVAVDANGNVYVSDLFNHTIRKISAEGVVTTLAGTAGVKDSADGAASAARFHDPEGLAADANGNLYVADAGNATIRRISPAGVVTTLAGNAAGSAGGTGEAGPLPTGGVAVDAANGSVYVADQDRHTIFKITTAGIVTTLAGSAQGRWGSVDGTGNAARFGDPYGVVVDANGSVYVADTHNHTIRKISAAGVVTTLAGSAGNDGSADGTGGAAQFYAVNGVAVDANGTVYVADGGNSTIRKISAAGVVTTLAGTAGKFGSADGPGGAAQSNAPFGVAVDAKGSVYVADTHNHTIRKISAAGVVTTLAGKAGSSGSADGTGSAARFDTPIGVAVDTSGTVYVADGRNSTIRKISAAGEVTTLAGSAGKVGSADGTGSDARFNGPYGLALDSSGSIYVADTGNRTIRKITAAGVVTTIGGTAGVLGQADGVGAAAEFRTPSGIASDGAGKLYVADPEAGRIILGSLPAPPFPR